MATILKPLTVMHIAASRKMPQKRTQLLHGEAAKERERWVKRERRDIARYYLLLRSQTIDGYELKEARIAHRYAVVRTGTEARVRVKNMKGE